MPRTNLSSLPASTAVSWDPELPAPGGLCAIHQPNLFPRLTTLAKLFAADYWIVLNDVQFTRRDYQQRTRLADLDDPNRRQWLSIPTHLPAGRPTTIRDALVVEPHRARRRTAAMLRQHYRSSPHWAALDQALDPVLDLFEATGKTAAVAEASTRILLDLLGWKGQILRSSQLSARPGRSQRLADLAAVTGARSYLCGTGGMKYLDAGLFAAAGIGVTPFRTPAGGMWDSGRQISALWALMNKGPQDMASRLRAIAAVQHELRPAA
ncbi:WbqC family protein [Streptomyces sp. H10-C2]|uniref:WbqC family protein n=1 Tax=unclassified Streptomyces TaxID=2593676 RepID=UPI0024B98B4A|nr:MULTISPECIES: WbqC family protein [unclassified Streptomyces]MDJ0341764.1 WbqC family protein [Streptomyces sp. PH10-H1]MDJ0368928.1 WbqC family protein [Streptomyces sp. H10-C2]